PRVTTKSMGSPTSASFARTPRASSRARKAAPSGQPSALRYHTSEARTPSARAGPDGNSVAKKARTPKSHAPERMRLGYTRGCRRSEDFGRRKSKDAGPRVESGVPARAFSLGDY